MLKTFVYSFALLLLSSLISLPLIAQKNNHREKQTNHNTIEVKQDSFSHSTPIRGVQYETSQKSATTLAAQKKIPLFVGVSVSADICGAIMAGVTPYGQYEAATRINLRGRYFPTFEIGIGTSNHTNETTSLHYRVHSPYYRIGMDYNIAKNVRGAGRILIGLRYAFTNYKFDVDGPDISDPIYGGLVPFNYKSLKGISHWGEAVFGLEARVCGILHLGWTIRYKMRLYNKETAIDNAWYIPGYGKNDTHALGGTFNIIFDI